LGGDPVTGPETITGWTVPGDKPITVTLEPVTSRTSYVYCEGRYVGILAFDYDVWRGYGYGQGLDGHRVAVEDDFDTREEAVQWLVDGYLSRAES
jgi:hypothetical protein